MKLSTILKKSRPAIRLTCEEQHINLFLVHVITFNTVRELKILILSSFLTHLPSLILLICFLLLSLTFYCSFLFFFLCFFFSGEKIGLRFPQKYIHIIHIYPSTDIGEKSNRALPSLKGGGYITGGLICTVK